MTTRLISLLLLGLIALVVQIATPFLVMIYGWGIQPKSWPVIIAGYVGTIFFMLLASALKDEK